MGEAQGQARGDLTALLEALAKAPEPGGAWAEELRPGEVLDRFQVVRELGRGGFGAVYEALDRDLGRRVALKTLRPGRARDEWADAAIRSEAQAAARLQHPGVVTLYEACTCEKGPYLVLELLQGETLEQRLGRGPLPLGEALEIGLQVARALAHVHGQGLVHRDLKPGNLHLGEDGRVKLLDLGLAHLLGGKAQSGGTPAYVAPEQWLGERVDGKADVFSLGAVLFEMLSGRRPFEVREGRSGAVDGATVPALPGKAPRRLAALVARCLAARPGDRPTAAQVAEELRALQQARTRPSLLRRLGLLALAGAAAGALLAGLAFWWLAPRAPPAGPDGRIVVAVADFANQTGEPALDALSGLLITSLEQSPRLRVLTRGRMFDLLRQLGRENVERIDEAVARELGARAGARALLLGSVARLGGRYVAELRALDPGQEHYLFTLREDAPDQAGLLPLLDRLSARARERLDGSQPGAALRLAAAVTPSLEAYRHYFKGKELAAHFDTEGAMREYRAALAVEPRFAMAMYELAFVTYLSAASGTEVIHQAAREADRAPEKEAGQIRTLEAALAGRFPEAVAGAARLSARFPDDADVAFLAAFIAELAGDFEGALPLLERVLRLHPDDRLVEVERFYLLHVLARPAQARADAAELLRRDPSPASRVSAAVERALAGDLPGAVRGFEEAGRGGEQGWAVWFRAQTLAALGRSGEAMAAFGPERSHLSDLARANVLSYAGQLRRGHELLAGAVRDPAAGTQLMTFNLAVYLAAAGDTEGARRAAPERPVFLAYEPMLRFELGDDARLRAALRDGLLPASLGGRLCQALIDWREGRKGEALERLRELDRSHEWLVPYYRGVLAAELGLHPETAEALGRFAEPILIEMDAMAHGWLQARARIQLARSLEALGRREEALRHLDRQLDLWREADEDLPLLAEARALRRRLAPAPAR